ncbi:MAG: DNA-directed RNA polymerase subunit beta', partial [Eggerthellaceae bacterium]|nr:DNA-directed RNA polymerase subunit beta' [Eggerthellaceae bacterium]
VAQDVIIRELDCGTKEGVVYPLQVIDKKNKSKKPDENLIGRCLIEDVVTSEGEVLAQAGSYIKSMAQIKEMIAAGLETVNVRTVMTCRAHHGVCQKCYGWDLATGRPVNIGTAVGIIAAQSIGEPGTQLTMRTFHTGGVAGSDITQGLPRVQELFEARRPKGLALIAEISGTLQVTGDKQSKKITIHDQEGNCTEVEVSPRTQLYEGVTDGCEVRVGQQLTKGSLYPVDLLRLTDLYTTLRYIVSEVQSVYQGEGVAISDKHIEVIARQMLRKVSVTEAGDSDLLPGSQMNRYEFEDIANALIAEGKNPPTATPQLLGITKASLATESFLSAASFQETTKVLTDSAIEGKVDMLSGLKENVLIGKPIPAGTGVPRYRNVTLTYKGKPVEKASADALPEDAPDMLRQIEELLPQAQDWQFDNDGYLGMGSRYYGMLGRRGKQLSDEDARLYIQDDLGVSQRWANKFSEAGIETVEDLWGKTEDELMRIEGIGNKAIEELKAGLEAHDLMWVIENDLTASLDDVSSLMDYVFSPDDTVILGGTSLNTYYGDDEEMLGEALPSRKYQQRLMTDELDELLLGDYGFSSITEDYEKKILDDEDNSSFESFIDDDEEDNEEE